MLVNTSDLTGPALDWAVATAQGYQSVYTNGSIRPIFRECEAVEITWPSYSTNWSQGGPLLDREEIDLQGPSHHKDALWTARCGSWNMDGPTALIAACRCYVASKMGDTVEIPDELL